MFEDYWDSVDIFTEGDMVQEEEEIILPHRFKPRSYQRDLLLTFAGMLDGENEVKNYCLVQHRRSGKDVGLFQLMVMASCTKVGDYAYFLPLSNQARRVIVKGIVQDSDGNPCQFKDYIPPSMYKGFNSVDSYFELTNGSKIYVTGSDNYNALVGMNIHGSVFSEWSICNPLAYDYIKPMINQNNGWVAFCFTPRGKNHAWHTMVNAQKETNKHRWFVTHLTVDDTKREDGTPVVSREVIQRDIDDGMDVDTIQQEYYLDFNAAVKGVIYGKEMVAVREEGRVCQLEIKKDVPVITFWDIGMSKGNATAIWCMQEYDNRLNLINYIEAEDEAVPFFLDQLNQFCKRHNVELGKMYYPHDGANREWTSGKKRHEQVIDMGYDVTVLPRTSDVELGIRQTKAIFDKLWFHEEYCGVGLIHLEHYRRKVIPSTMMLGTPLHDDSSNCADALRQMGQYYASGVVDARHSTERQQEFARAAMIRSRDYSVGSNNNYDVGKVRWNI